MNRQFADAVSQILSLRGNKLTVVLHGRKNTANRSGKHVWVVQASSQPRAWCKRDVPAGQLSESWREARFLSDELLVHPDVCQEAMAEIVKVLDTSRRWHLTPGVYVDFESWEQEKQRRMVALARSRRRVGELRRQGTFAGLGGDVLKARLAGIRDDFGVWNRERDEENDVIQASKDLHYREPAQAFRRSPHLFPSHTEQEEIRCNTLSVSNDIFLFGIHPAVG